MLRWIKHPLCSAIALVVVDFLLLGANCTSYLRTSAYSVQESV